MTTNSEYITATIAAGESLSTVVELGVSTMCGVVLPAAWTAAKVSFESSVDGVTFGPVYDMAGVIGSAANQAANDVISVDPARFLGFSYIKIRSGVPGALVNQVDSRTLTVIARNLG